MTLSVTGGSPSQNVGDPASYEATVLVACNCTEVAAAYHNMIIYMVQHGRSDPPTRRKQCWYVGR